MVGKSIVLLLIVAITGNCVLYHGKEYIPLTVTVDENGVVTHSVPITPSKKPTQYESTRPVELSKVENCGIAPLAPSEDDLEKIVGGTSAVTGEFPWQAALFIDILFFCGGSLISDEWIMTAGHCLHERNDVKVILGINNLNVSEPNEEHFDSKNFFTHEDYSPTLIHNDIALIRLPRKVNFTDYIQPVCLPPPPDIAADVIVTATGWGKTKDGVFQGVSDELQKVDVLTADTEVCRSYYGALIVTDNILCVNTTGGHGPCNGDSGGPLNYKNAGGFTEARGITSFGSSEGCQSGAPGAFTRVSHYTDWIANKTGVTFY